MAIGEKDMELNSEYNKDSREFITNEQNLEVNT